MARNLLAALEKFPATVSRNEIGVLFTAHSIPLSMAETSRYVTQLEEASRLVAERAGITSWQLVYQSRSGPPSQPWLEPDVCDEIRKRAASGCRHIVLVPIGFISDHMEVLYDLDEEAAAVCQELEVTMHRAATVGTDPEFVSMIRELIAERAWNLPERTAIGNLPANHDVCPLDCCPAPPRRPVAAAAPQTS